MSDDGYTAYDDGHVRIVLKCPCTCWYCLCTRDGHCGSGRCGAVVTRRYACGAEAK